MRILVAIVHYFRAEQAPKHASVDGTLTEKRRCRTQSVIEAYRGLFGRPATIDIATKRLQLGPGNGHDVDLAVVTVPGCSLLDPEFLGSHGVTRVEAEPDNPRMLGFHVHELFARLHSEYDLFVYTEDDLRPTDSDMFTKVRWFAAAGDGRRVLAPNRFEWNTAGPAIKTYIDGDLRAGLADRLMAFRPDVDHIEMNALGRARVFRRARNPHAGFFALTQAQLVYWMDQPHWLDRDCGFISPLESAATLGVAKTFSIFKPFGASADFLELQHLDARFSSLRLPWESTGLAALAYRIPPEAVTPS
jgi:hypothetical protein